MEIVDQVRHAASIIDIASQYTTLRRRGKKYVGLCPFHSEKDPSFTVDEEKQLFHCFGCGVGGDIFTLVMEKENISFPEALRQLAQKYNIALPEKRRLSPQRLKEEEKLHKINEDSLAFFKKNLYKTREGQKALDYLKKRKISEEIIQKLKIGYALNSWDALLSFFRGKNTSPELLEKAGLVIPSQKKEGYYDRFRGRIIFPIFGVTGKVVAFGGRTIFDSEPKYLNSPETPVYFKGKLLYGLNFTKESIREKGEMILVEGYTDFLSLFSAGITNVAASLGTSLTPDQVIAARRFASAEKMVVSFDADPAGKKAAARAISLCFENKMQIRVLNLPPKMDPDSYINKYGSDSFQELVTKSTQGLKFLIDYFLQEGEVETPEGKSKIARNVVDEIGRIPDTVVRSEYLKRASDLLDIEEDDLRRIARQKPSDEERVTKKSFFQAEKRLLQVLFEDKLIAPYVFKEMRDEDFQGLYGEPLFLTISSYFKREKKMMAFHKIREKVGSSLSNALSEILQEKSQPPTPEEALDCLYSLRRLSLEKKSKELKAEIKRLERKGEKEKPLFLLNQLQQIKKQLTTLSEQNIKEIGYNNKSDMTTSNGS